MKRQLFLSTAIISVLMFAAQPPAHASLITNGGFETGDFTGWATGGNFEFSQVVTGGYYLYSSAPEGIYYATFGPAGPDGWIRQTLSTSAGSGYTVSFDLIAVGDDPSDFSASWNGAPLVSTIDPDTGNNWTLYSFPVTGTGSDILTLNFRDDPQFIGLDNVSVSSSAVPEPGSVLLLGSGLLAVVSRIRRAKR